jgi:predicted anti-sigma-YlaC factor YlaD
MLSGYLDHALTQGAEQRVRLHLEDCAHCRALYDELRAHREVTMTTRFEEPSDDQWDERPRTVAAGFARGLAWVLIVVWLAAVSVFGAWQWWQAPQTVFERLLVFGLASGFGLLLLSVILDRLRAARSDRYTEVQR